MQMYEFLLKLRCVPKGPINNIPALVPTMAWHQPGNKPLSEPMMAQVGDAYMHHSAWMRPEWVHTQIGAVVEFRLRHVYC